MCNFFYFITVIYICFIKYKEKVIKLFENNNLDKFFINKSISKIIAGCTAYSGASIYTGGTLSGATYFQNIDDTQLAAYGGKLTGGTLLK